MAYDPTLRTYTLWMQTIDGTEEEVTVGPCECIDAVYHARNLMMKSEYYTSYTMEVQDDEPNRTDQ